MDDILFRIGSHAVTLGEALVVIAALAIALAAIVFFIASRRAAERALAAERAEEMEGRMAALVSAQGAMNERMQTMAEIFGSRQADMMRGISERMDGLGHRMNQTLTDTTRSTQENLSKLGERLAVIDKAQQNITALSGQVVKLENILSNKQTRGAFGQARMEAIVQDGLPNGAYEFQKTLSNGNRPDCMILLPNGAHGLVIDAKFPLEAWNAMRAADGLEAARAAEGQFRRDTLKHIQDIASRYLLAGETQDTAFMFIPSESIFADIHERFEDVVQKAHRSHIVIVSPSLLMLSIQVVQSLLRDARMREQAHVIQAEVVKLMDDVRRLDDRVRKLGAHFGAAANDVEQILTSTRKIMKRGGEIEAVELGEDEAPAARKSPDLPELPFTQIEEA
ncbi:MAG: DNA recombination protein RmuC [Rhizobiales bacterium]|nr:DNA recombination protein RmuC [Hyphomicrobiales bacterium]